MARPKLGEGETLRLHIKFSDEEATAIDDWRFSNRVENRSEAIRRLVQIGLRADARAVEIAAAARETLDACGDLSNKIFDSVQSGTVNQEIGLRLWGDLFDGAAKKSTETLDAARALVQDVNAFHANTGAEDEIAKAIESRAQYKELVEAQRKAGIFG